MRAREDLALRHVAPSVRVQPRAAVDAQPQVGSLGLQAQLARDGEALYEPRLALGRSYPETGGVNESAVHWDLICDLRDGGRLLADGEPVAVA